MLLHIFRSWRRFCLAALLLLAAVLGPAAPAMAQTTSGVITGTITDAQGGVLPGVTVTVRNTETGVTRTVVTEANGSYRFGGLPPGRYDLKTELQGFAPAEVTGLVLTIGLERERDLTMALQGVQESVTVMGAAAIVETTKSEVSGVITQEQIQMLPVQNRQAVSLVLLMPGTGADVIRPRKVNANIGAGGVSVYSSTYLVDGTMNMSSTVGEPRQDFPQGAIREFKVHISQPPAEYGGRTGGVVTIVTKSGTNRFSGEAFEFFRDTSLNAMDKFQKEQYDLGQPKPGYRRHQYGGSLGGAVIRDRLHFFVAADRTNETAPVVVKTGRADLYGSLEGNFEDERYRHLYFFRGDAQLTPQQSVFIRYGWEEDDRPYDTAGGQNAMFSGTGVSQPRDSLVGGHTWVVSSRALNEIRFQRAYQWHLQYPPGKDPWRGGWANSRLSGPSTSRRRIPSPV